MTPDDVYPDDMDPLTPEQLEEAFNAATVGPASDAGVSHPTTDFLTEAVEALRAVEAPQPDATLREFIGVSSVVSVPVHGAVATDNVVPMNRSKGPRMITSFAAAAATTGGKLLLGAAALAGIAGGAQVSGVVDFVPDDAPLTVHVAAQPDVASDGVIGEFRVPVDDIGSVTLTVEVDALRTGGVAFAAGWSASEDRPVGPSVEVSFSNGVGAQRKFEARLDDGRVKVEIFDPATGVETTTYYDLLGRAMVPALGQTPTPTVVTAATPEAVISAIPTVVETPTTDVTPDATAEPTASVEATPQPGDSDSDDDDDFDDDDEFDDSDSADGDDFDDDDEFDDSDSDDDDDEFDDSDSADGDDFDDDDEFDDSDSADGDDFDDSDSADDDEFDDSDSADGDDFDDDDEFDDSDSADGDDFDDDDEFDDSDSADDDERDD